MTDQYAPVRGKCLYWRQVPHPEDEYDFRKKAPEKRVNCSCFVEGHGWAVTRATLPMDCPKGRQCRYYIKAY